ncbi:hypothetical protein KEM52_001999 [Ascosphaera acerosa]|nr:hypothetical protein KEM52_001999 [Ascosphaera acerosa]
MAPTLQSPSPFWTSFRSFAVPVLATAAYLLVVRVLRYRRRDGLYRKYRHVADKSSFCRMTVQQAWEICVEIGSDFPTSSLVALQFALFRTYGIPSISRLLVKTGQLATKQTSLKRYADTSVLIREFFAQPPTAARAHEAIARMNYIHSGYRASGSITDDDMLYTLSLFACEPWRWIDTYEWRKLTDLELCAMGTFWRSIGDAMEISYEKLPSGRRGTALPHQGEETLGGPDASQQQDDFQNGLHWLQELKQWSLGYEQAHMIPDRNNKIIADLTVGVLLYSLPSALHRLATNLVHYLMDDRLREAMIAGVSLRKWFLRTLFLPRPSFLGLGAGLDDNPSADAYHDLSTWEGAPYYIKTTTWRRWSPAAWVTWAMGNPLPGDNRLEYAPEGYLIREVGPRAFQGKGEEYMARTKRRLASERRGGCPFAIR